jgi:hypothetical protein
VLSLAVAQRVSCLDSSCLTPPQVLAFVFHGDMAFLCKVMLMSSESIPSMTLLSYLVIFGWTCALEAPWYLFGLRHLRVSWPRSIFILLFANLATHPLVTFVFPRISQALGLTLGWGIFAEEIFAPVVEAIVIRKIAKISWPWAILISIAANLFSWWVGALLPQSWF